jgi:ABC-type multidrug transport system fused ATPase/permease subunit
MWENSRMTDTPASEQPDGLDWSRVSRFNRDKPQANYPGSQEATSAASFLSAVAWLFTVLVVIVGVYLVIYSDPLFDRMTDVSFFTRHPHAVTGIAFVIHGSVLMMAIVMAANFVKAMMAFNAMAGAFFQAFAAAGNETKRSGSDAQAEDTRGPQNEPPAQTSANTMSHTPNARGKVLGWFFQAYAEPGDTHGPQTEPPAQTSANTMSHTPAFHGNVPGWYPDHIYGMSEKSVRWWDGNKWAGL